MMRNLSLCLSLLLSFLLPAAAQEADSVVARMTRQLQLFPQEMLHLQTDKQAYLSGERIWLRAHLVDALTLRPEPLSRYVYVELVNPFDEVVRRIQIRPDSVGVHAGYMDLDEALPEGDYTLRAYTRYRLNLGEAGFFRKSVRVLDPYSLELETDASFRFNDNGLDLQLRFKDRKNGQETLPKVVTVQRKGKAAASLKPRDGAYVLHLPAETAGKAVLLGLKHEGRKYQRFLPVPWPDGEFDVALLPEGGYLVPGRACRVGVKAIRPDGLGELVSGSVLDPDGHEVASFGPLEHGLGSFLLRAEAGVRYAAACTTASGAVRHFDLPAAEATARTLQLIPVRNALLVNVLRGAEAPGEPLSLLVHHRGLPLFHGIWDAERPALSFPLTSLPVGVLHFLLLDGDDRILSERLYFHWSPDAVIRPGASFSKDSYRSRDRVCLTVPWKADQAPARLALSVVDGETAVPDRGCGLLSTLELTSELRGRIELPDRYFTPEGSADMEALMLTQGWRRYDLPAVLQGRTSAPAILPERHQEIRGQADAKIFSSINGGRISLYAVRDSMTSVDFVNPDPDGRYLFRTEFPEGTEVTVQGQNRKGGTSVILAVDPEVFPSPAGASLPMRGAGKLLSDVSDPYMRQADEAYLLQNGERTAVLDAAVVTADRSVGEVDSEWYSPVTASPPLTAEEIGQRNFTSILSVYLNTSGLTVRSGSGGSYLTTTRSEMPILPVIDNAVMPEFDLMTLNPGDIASIFVIKDQTSMFGYYPSHSGALVITTTVGSTGAKHSDHIARFRPQGYQMPAAFYAPKYDTAQKRDEGLADLRTTLFWDPEVLCLPGAETLVEFYAADPKTRYLVTGEGVTADGKPVLLEAEVTVE